MGSDLIELIRLMNEKPIAFNKHYVFLGCGINGAVMLSQLVYWADKSKDPNGWIYKTSKEWTEETGLTRREQDTARKNLKELGFIDEHKHGVPCKIHFKVNQEVLYGALLSLAQKRQTDAQKRQTECTDQPNLVGAIRQTNTDSTQKNTTENTTDIVIKTEKPKVKNFDPLIITLPNNVNHQTWVDFVAMRKSIKKPLSEQAAKLILNKLVKFGESANASLEQSIEASWSSVYPLKNQNNNFQAPKSTNNTFNRLGELADEWDNQNADYTPY